MERVGGVIVALFALAFPASLASVFAHGAKEPEQVELVGEIVDLACFVTHAVRGPENAICAEHHGGEGQPIALLTDGGKTYVLYAYQKSVFPYALARDLVGARVKVKGVADERDGVAVFEVREVVRQSEGGG